MTSDPDRLLACASMDDEAELERELLRSIVDVSPPAHAKREAWDGIASRLAAASAAAAGASIAARAAAASQALPAAKASAPVATGLAKMLATKVVVGAVVAIGATAAVSSLWLHRSRESEKTESTATASKPDRVEAQVPPKAVSAPDVVASEPSPAAPPDPSAQHDARGSARATPRQPMEEALALESSLLMEARASLRRGDPGGALAALGRLDQKSPHGVLRQEREVLTIQALAASGDRTAASRRAKSFVEAYPNSPHTPLLRRLTSEP